jgi:hypothetical protein
MKCNIFLLNLPQIKYAVHSYFFCYPADGNKNANCRRNQISLAVRRDIIYLKALANELLTLIIYC